MTTNRRGFLGGAGAVGVAMSTIFERAVPVEAQTKGGGTVQVVSPGYIIHHGDLTAEFRGNELYPSRINGVNSLFHVASPSVSAFDGPGGTGTGGLDYEHIMIGEEDARNQFSPRSGPYTMSILGPTTVQMVRRWEDEPWQIGAVVTYEMVAPHYIDLTVRVTPHNAALFGQTAWVLFMFADYMSPVADASLHFRGVTGLGQAEQWLARDATLNLKTNQPDPYNAGGTWIAENAFPLTIGPNYSTGINVQSYAWPRFTVPMYYVRSRNAMVFQLMLDQAWSPEAECRLTQMHYKIKKDPLNPKPAADWQYVVHRPVSGQTYGFRARMLWKPWVSEEDCLAEDTNWRAGL